MRVKGSALWMARLIVISQIVIVLLAIIFVVILWQKNTGILMNSIDRLSVENPNIESLESGIATLYQADNNFKYYLATNNKNYFNDYRNNLFTVTGIIDSLQTSLVGSENTNSISNSLNQKADISDIIIRLKMLTDSLLTVAKVWDTNELRNAVVPEYDIRKIQNLQKRTSIDSIIGVETGKKKGFMQKIKSIFKDDSLPQNNKIVVKRTEASNDTIIETNIKTSPEYALLRDIHSYYSDKINKYSESRSKLNSNEKNLAIINGQLIQEISGILQQIKQAELETTSSIKNKAMLAGEKSAKSISVIAVLSSLSAAAFSLLVIFYLRKIRESSKSLESEKLKAEKLSLQKSRFLSGMSHEIRAPLNNVLGFAEQLTLNPEEHREKYLSAIYTSSEIMLSTVNQILDFSKLESGKMSFNTDTFNLYKAIESAGSTFLLRAKEKKLLLNFHLPLNEDILVSGDEFRLKQIIVNLVDNAIKYTEKGEVNVRAHSKPDGNHYLSYIEVSDTGIGIPSNKHEDIFNEFERLEDFGNRRWQPGTGLGLAIAKMVIEQQGGKIYIKESTDKGTAFAIELPFQVPQKKINVSPEQQSSNSIKPGKTILLADDDDFSVLLISAICKKHNINLISAENGQIAIDLVLNNKIDLVLTDINMPVLSGLDFAHKLRSIPDISSIPIIAITANVMTDDVKQMTEVGVNEVLFKPFREKDFIQKINLFLQ